MGYCKLHTLDLPCPACAELDAARKEARRTAFLEAAGMAQEMAGAEFGADPDTYEGRRALRACAVKLLALADATD
jgi:hypothetical protein